MIWCLLIAAIVAAVVGWALWAWWPTADDVPPGGVL
jgi:hypothetical protein